MDLRLFAYIVVGVLVGAGVALQATINSALSRTTGALEATFVSVTVTLILIGTLLLVGLSSGHLGQVASAPRYLLVGGILGGAFLISAVLLVPKVGAVSFLTSVVVGQLAGALVLDHFGVLGLPRIPLSLPRVLGILLLLAGMRLVFR
ncbi:MAG: DMT family transporter [Dehalococcoidia bacterium]|nr:DMT family transporter [Dehalococcoidia bacterium]